MTWSEELVPLVVRGRQLAAVVHHGDGDGVVVFCHGFRGEKTGPQRAFVRAARALAGRGVTSLRFDQYGSGDSEGDFLDSSFADWVLACREVTRPYLEQRRPVALFGQSMGAAAALCAAADLPGLAAVVAWVPDANVDPWTPPPAGFVEEGGQRVGNAFWSEARQADVVGCFGRRAAPAHLVFGTEDEHVSADNRVALVRQARTGDLVDVLEGYPHSAWTFDQTGGVITRSVGFLARHGVGRAG